MAHYDGVRVSTGPVLTLSKSSARTDPSPQVVERLPSGGEQRLCADGSARRFLHPQIRRDIPDRGHALELRPDGSRSFHLVLDLEGDQVADGIVGKVERRVDHV